MFIIYEVHPIHNRMLKGNTTLERGRLDGINILRDTMNYKIIQSFTVWHAVSTRAHGINNNLFLSDCLSFATKISYHIAILSLYKRSSYTTGAGESMEENGREGCTGADHLQLRVQLNTHILNELLYDCPQFALL